MKRTLGILQDFLVIDTFITVNRRGGYMDTFSMFITLYDGKWLAHIILSFLLFSDRCQKMT